MRRTLPLLLTLLLAAPVARAADDEEEEEAPKAKKKVKGDSAEGTPDFDGVELTPKRKKKKNVEAPGKSDPTEKTAKGKTPSDDDKERPELAKGDEEDAAPRAGFSRHRYGYVLGGGFFVAGLAFAYSAQGEGKRAETIGTAREASVALDNARASAATANVIYGVAIVTLAITLVFELLPRSVAERASLTFHF